MPFRESRNSRSNAGKLEEIVDRTLSYIVEQSGADRSEVIPPLAAAKLGLPLVEILAALMVLEDRGVLRHFYRIYCQAKDVVLGDVVHKEDVAAHLYCKYCDCQHGQDDVDVEVVFRIDRQGLNDLLRKRAVA